MSENDWFTGVALAISAVLIIGILVGLGLGGIVVGAPEAPSAAPSSEQPVYLYFTVTTSAATQYDTYYPANVTIPHGQPIVITITCYDNGVNNVTTPYADVIGTLGGVANYTNGLGNSTDMVASWPPALISHTFTVVLPGEAGNLETESGSPLINVPVPVSPDGIHPATVTFSVEFDHSAYLQWRCFAPCDPYSMATPGFMIGSITVT
jgi:hypothetical protein